MRNVTASLFYWKSDIFRILYIPNFFEVQNNPSHALSVSTAFSSVVEFSQARRFIWLVFLKVSWGGVRLSPLGTSATNWPLYQPRMIDDDDDDDDDECGAVGGMRIGKGNRRTGRKPAPVPLRSPQIPHDLTWARTRAAALGSRRLTA
jgi:hypothetical protein